MVCEYVFNIISNLIPYSNTNKLPKKPKIPSYTDIINNEIRNRQYDDSILLLVDNKDPSTWNDDEMKIMDREYRKRELDMWRLHMYIYHNIPFEQTENGWNSWFET